MNSFRHYTLFLLSLLYMSLAIGLIGCSDDDEPEVYPSAVYPSFTGSVQILPDTTMLVQGGVYLQFRGGGNDLLMPEESSPGCFGFSSSDPDPIYEIGDGANLENATVELNGFPLTNVTDWKYNPGPRYDMPEDSFLVLHEGDSLHLEYDVPNEDELPMAEIVLYPDYYPYMPDNYSTTGLNDTLVLPLRREYSFYCRNKVGYEAFELVDERENSDGIVSAYYTLLEDRVAVGDTIELVVSWGHYLDSGISWINYLQNHSLIVTE